MKSTAIVKTAKASRYLQQLCKHWSHKYDCTFDTHQGRILFASGNLLELAATDDRLTMHASVPNNGDLAAFKQIVDNHLLRFSFREEMTILWN